ncbi:MAG: hypothetical protein ACRENX_04935 [Candidatus Dormibacteria bacterium]
MSTRASRYGLTFKASPSCRRSEPWGWDIVLRFQHYAPFRHLGVLENFAFGLRV